MMKFYVAALLVLCLCFPGALRAQDKPGYKWWNPATNEFPAIEGQGWPKELSDPYERLPARAQKTVTSDIWDLSRNSTGLFLKFKTNARNITVRYIVKNRLAMPHMPSTGVSGLDLYGIDVNGKWNWTPGKYSFGDTIRYSFSGMLSREDSVRNFEYRLYLPLYNTVSWLEIGVPDNKNFVPMPLRSEKPIVVYGTSIAQGACASRTGLAWTAILERNLDRPMINLGFSGNGHLDKEVIDLITEIDAKIYVLDCLPNLIVQSQYSDEEVDRRIKSAVKQIREKRPSAPILLVEHASGSPDNGRNLAIDNSYEHTNNVLRKSFAAMKTEGEKGIFLLSAKEIGFDMYSTVDGEHPTDIGMEKYATAFEKSIRQILNEPVGSVTTTRPCVQSRDDFYDWRIRHQEILAMNRAGTSKTAILGNSIIHIWGGKPVASLVNGADSWNDVMEPLNTINMGFGWDKIENVLWRVYHDELDGITPDRILLMIGTNNLGSDSNETIIAGLKMLIGAVKSRQPNAKIVSSGILPRRGMEKRIVLLNLQIAKLAASMKVGYMDPGKSLLNNKQTIDEALFGDGLHPNAEGYKKLANAMKPYLKK